MLQLPFGSDRRAGRRVLAPRSETEQYAPTPGREAVQGATPGAAADSVIVKRGEALAPCPDAASDDQPYHHWQIYGVTMLGMHRRP